MLTPDDIQKKIFGLGRKYENTEIGIFIKELQINYQLVYDQVQEQEKQIKGMEKRLRYYRDVEGNLQDALVHAEKVSNEKIKEAREDAAKIEEAAHMKAKDIIDEAEKELVSIRKQIDDLKKAYIVYQDKYKEFVQGQIKFIDDSRTFIENEKVHVDKFVEEKTVVQDNVVENIDSTEEVVDANEATIVEVKEVEKEVNNEQHVNVETDKESNVEQLSTTLVEENNENINADTDSFVNVENNINTNNEEKITEDDAMKNINLDVVSEQTAPIFKMPQFEMPKQVVVVEEDEEINQVDVGNISTDDKIGESSNVVDELPKVEITQEEVTQVEEVQQFEAVSQIETIPQVEEAIVDNPMDILASFENPTDIQDVKSLDELARDDDAYDYTSPNLNSDVSTETSDTNQSDIFNLPEINVDDLDFPNLDSLPNVEGVDFNNISIPEPVGVDFNAMNQPKPAGVDFNAMNQPKPAGVDFNTMSQPKPAGVDFNAMNQPEPVGVDFNAMSHPKPAGVDFNAMNQPEPVGVDFNTMNQPETSGEKDDEDMGPDLSQNANIQLTYANDSMFPKKKDNNKEKVLASLNISSNKEDELARIKKLESAYSQELLNSNKQLANEQKSEDELNKENSTTRGYGPVDFVSQNNGYITKPLKPESETPENKPLF